MSHERWFNEGGTVLDENRLVVAHVVGQEEDDSDARMIAASPALLDFAEMVANNSSASLHGFHSELVAAARRVVKAAGGRLDKIGRFEAGSCAHKPAEKFDGERWVHPVLDREGDRWEFPT